MGIVPLMISYEEVSANPEQVARQVAAAVGEPAIAERTARENSYAGITVQRTERNQEWARRYEAETMGVAHYRSLLQQHLRAMPVNGTPLAEIRGLNQRFFDRNFLDRSQELVINGAVTEYIQSEGVSKPRHRPLRLAVPMKPSTDTGSPTVACVMVTADRPAQARVAVECYRRQSWSHRTLTILDTGRDDSLGQWLMEINDPSISYHRAERELMTLGDLRNAAVSRSRGEYICIWDDDDLHHPLRIEIQMSAISQSKAEACILGRLMVWWPFKTQLVASHVQAWEGTILSSRKAMVPYASEERGEDTVAIHALRQGNRVAYLNAPELYVYVRHLRNTWEDDHFDVYRRKALTQYSTSEYAGILPWLRNAFPIDEYLDALQV